MSPNPPPLTHAQRMLQRRLKYKAMQAAFCRTRYPRNHVSNTQKTEN